MDNKLTDNEIMKAFEQLIQIHKNQMLLPFSDILMMDIALKELNRQKAEIERLNNEEKALLYTVEGMRKERTRMQTILVNFMDEVYEWGNKNNVDTNNFAQIAILGIERDSAVRQIKSEAIREFAERLKQMVLFDGGWEVMQPGTIDTLLKEMEGEDGLN